MFVRQQLLESKYTLMGVVIPSHPVGSVCWCVFLGLFYVLSLYMWPGAFHADRDEPAQIRRRFISVAIVSVTSLTGFGVFWCISDSNSVYTVFELCGIAPDSFIMGFALPLMLTAVLFLGPLVQSVDTVRAILVAWFHFFFFADAHRRAVARDKA